MTMPELLRAIRHCPPNDLAFAFAAGINVLAIAVDITGGRWSAAGWQTLAIVAVVAMRELLAAAVRSSAAQVTSYEAQASMYAQMKTIGGSVVEVQPVSTRRH